MAQRGAGYAIFVESKNGSTLILSIYSIWSKNGEDVSVGWEKTRLRLFLLSVGGVPILHLREHGLVETLRHRTNSFPFVSRSRLYIPLCQNLPQERLVLIPTLHRAYRHDDSVQMPF